MPKADYLKKAEGRLKAAELLLEKGYLEDAVSRAYYSMYNAAKAALATKKKDAKTHKGLIALFGKEFVKGGEVDPSIGKAFSYVEEEREDADYEPLIEVSGNEARKVVEKARKFLNEVKKILEKRH